jgi:hypothetical protein
MSTLSSNEQFRLIKQLLMPDSFGQAFQVAKVDVGQKIITLRECDLYVSEAQALIDWLKQALPQGAADEPLTERVSTTARVIDKKWVSFDDYRRVAEAYERLTFGRPVSPPSVWRSVAVDPPPPGMDRIVLAFTGDAYSAEYANELNAIDHSMWLEFPLVATVTKGSVICEPADDRKYKWEIEPHPYTKDFDMYVTDDDEEALEAIKFAAEIAWDSSEEGEERVLKIRMNAVATQGESVDR